MTIPFPYPDELSLEALPEIPAGQTWAKGPSERVDLLEIFVAEHGFRSSFQGAAVGELT